MDIVVVLTYTVAIIILVAIVVAFVAVVVKLTRSESVRAASSGIGLAMFAGSVALNLPPLRSGLIPLVGAGGLFLIVEVLYLFGGYFLKVAFVPAGRLHGQGSWRQLDTFVVILVSVIVILLYLQADTAEIVGHALQSNEEAYAQAIITLVRLYAMGTGMLVIPRAISLIKAPWFARTGRIGATVVFLGYVTALSVAVFRLVVDGPITPSNSMLVAEMILAPLSFLLIVTGHLIIFLRRRPFEWSPVERTSAFTTTNVGARK